MPKATARDRARWLRRADTLQRKAGELMSEMIGVVGVEHEATDYVDAVIERCDELTSVLSKPNLEMWKR